MDNQKIIKIIQNTFPSHQEKITLETTPNDVDEWDSLGQIMLVQAIEEALALSFELDELLNFDSVKSIIEIVRLKTEN
jgi:acyl carrier protein